MTVDIHPSQSRAGLPRLDTDHPLSPALWGPRLPGSPPSQGAVGPEDTALGGSQCRGAPISLNQTDGDGGWGWGLQFSLCYFLTLGVTWKKSTLPS